MNTDRDQARAEGRRVGIGIGCYVEGTGVGPYEGAFVRVETNGTVVVATGLGQGRNLLVVRSAAAVIAVGGSWGTLSEVAFARRLGRPVVWLRGWEVRGPDDVVPVATSAEDAVAQTLAALSADV